MNSLIDLLRIIFDFALVCLVLAGANTLLRYFTKDFLGE